MKKLFVGAALAILLGHIHLVGLAPKPIVNQEPVVLATQHPEVQVSSAEYKEPEPVYVAPEPVYTPPVYVPSNPGNCTDWMAQAGIPLTTATQKLILNESGCRTTAVNPSSGACGIPQAYPCSKLPCPLNDSGAVCQLQWMDNYVKNRYGTWENALSTWYSRCGSPQGCWY